MKEKDDFESKLLKEVKIASDNKKPSEERLNKRIDSIINHHRQTKSKGRNKYILFKNLAVSKKQIFSIAASFLVAVSTYYLSFNNLGGVKSPIEKIAKIEKPFGDSLKSKSIDSVESNPDNVKSENVIDIGSHIVFEELKTIPVYELTNDLGFALEDSIAFVGGRANIISKVNSILELTLIFTTKTTTNVDFSEWFYVEDKKQIFETRIKLQYKNGLFYVGLEKKNKPTPFEKNKKKISSKKMFLLKKNL